MRGFRNFLILSAIVITFAGSSARANLIVNGSFENGTDPGSYLTLSSGATDITGWTIGGEIDYIGTYWQASDGGRSIDLSGTAAGSIQQDIDTVAGSTYTVTFDMAGNPDGLPTIKQLLVEAVGVDSEAFDFDITGTSKSDMGWITYEWTFVATDSTTTIKFSSLSGDTGWGPALDNVGVTLVPAPGAMALLGIGTGIVGWLRRRKTL